MLKILHARLQQSWSRAWQPTPVLLPGESPGQRDLVGYSTWGHKELDTTEQQSTTQHKLQQYVNWKLTDVQAGFRKVRGTRDLNVNILWVIKKAREFQKISTSALLTMPKPLTVWITTNWKTLQEMGIPDHLTCLLRNLYADQEAAVRTRHGTMDWFKTGRGVRQGCILSPCLFNLHAEYITQNAGLDEA